MSICSYRALEANERRVAHLIAALCKGCGTCAAACPSGAISLNLFQDEQLLTQIEAFEES